MKKLNVLFLGTDSFSVPFLYYIHQHNNFNVVGVVTKTPKLVGRGGGVVKNIVALHADKLGLKVYEVTSFSGDNHQIDIDWESIDYVVVVSFAYIIPTSILNKLPNKFINVHPSLLPKYRGPAPIQQALLNGDLKAGVSIMVLDSGMDTGPVLSQKSLTILPDDNIYTLSDKLIDLSKEMLADSLVKYNKALLKPVAQKNVGVSVTSKVKKEDGFVTLKEKPLEVYNKYRAYLIWPGIYTSLGHLEEFIGVKTKIKDKKQIIKLKQIVLKNNKEIQISKVQLPNKPLISIQDFLNGYCI